MAANLVTVVLELGLPLPTTPRTPPVFSAQELQVDAHFPIQFAIRPKFEFESDLAWIVTALTSRKLL